MTHRVSHLPPHLEGQSSWLSKATSARILGHPLVWSGVTGLLIFAGYLWLQNYALPLSDQLGQLHSDSELVGSKSRNAWNPDIYRPTETKESMPITHQADRLRAEKYRETIEQENKIQPLLEQARSYIEQEIYTSQNQNNAWLSYQQILNIEPGHKLAQSGQGQILGLLQSNAEYATDEFEYEEAEQWLGQLDIIEPNAPFQANLRQRIVEQIEAEIIAQEAKLRKAERRKLLNNALRDAEDAMQASPSKLRAAYDLYQRALELEEQNKDALEGLINIHLARAARARLAITEMSFLEARTQIDRLLETKAESELIEKLESDLLKAQAEHTKQQQSSLNPAPERKPVENNTPPDPKPIPVTEPAKIPTVTAPSPNTSKGKISDSKEIETIEVQVYKSPSKPPVGDAKDSAPVRPAISNKNQLLSSGINAYYSGDYNTAFTNLHPLAEANSPRAQFRLGIMYFQGRTVVKNEDLARQWIARALPAVLRSAQKGQAWAQADLGTAYELGIGVKQDLTRAASLYLKAAKQGYAGAQTNLGVLYGTGEGVNYNRKAAIYWLKKAAVQGDKIAQDNLKILNAR